MPSLYEINNQIMSCVDMETGEIIDTDALDALMMERDEKIESIALWIKNLQSDAVAFKAEKDAFADREKKATAKAEKLKQYLAYSLNGQKFQTSKCAVSFRRTEKVIVDNKDIIPAEYLKKTVTYDPDKIAIKDAIKAGKQIDGCTLVQNLSATIK